MIAGGFFVLLVLIGFDAAEAHAGPDTLPVVLFQAQGAEQSPGGEGGFRWEQDLRWFSLRLLKSIRRTWIRFTRLVRRSADYWLGWLLGSACLLVVGGVVSTVDWRMLAMARQRGLRAAVEYARVGLVVFLRLLRDRRIPGRIRILVPVAILYAAFSSGWLRLGSSLIIDWAFDAFVVIAASRWFVRRCPDALIEEHAVRARTPPAKRVSLSSSSSQPRP